jgi:hypothetical protein
MAVWNLTLEGLCVGALLGAIGMLVIITGVSRGG